MAAAGNYLACFGTYRPLNTVPDKKDVIWPGWAGRYPAFFFFTPGSLGPALLLGVFVFCMDMGPFEAGLSISRCPGRVEGTGQEVSRLFFLVCLGVGRGCSLVSGGECRALLRLVTRSWTSWQSVSNIVLVLQGVVNPSTGREAQPGSGVVTSSHCEGFILFLRAEAR